VQELNCDTDQNNADIQVLNMFLTDTSGKVTRQASCCRFWYMLQQLFPGVGLVETNIILSQRHVHIQTGQCDIASIS